MEPVTSEAAVLYGREDKRFERSLDEDRIPAFTVDGAVNMKPAGLKVAPYFMDNADVELWLKMNRRLHVKASKTQSFRDENNKRVVEPFVARLSKVNFSYIMSLLETIAFNVGIFVLELTFLGNTQRPSLCFERSQPRRRRKCFLRNLPIGLFLLFFYFSFRRRASQGTRLFSVVGVSFPSTSLALESRMCRRATGSVECAKSTERSRMCGADIVHCLEAR